MEVFVRTVFVTYSICLCRNSLTRHPPIHPCCKQQDCSLLMNEQYSIATQRTWVWVNSRSWRWTGRPGELQSMGLQESDTTERLNLTEMNWMLYCVYVCIYIYIYIHTHTPRPYLLHMEHSWLVRPDSEEQHLEAVHFCWRPPSVPGLMPAGDIERAPFSTVKQRGQVNSIKTPRNCSYLNLQCLNKSIKRQKIMSNFYLHFQPKLQVIPLPVYSRHIQCLLF